MKYRARLAKLAKVFRPKWTPVVIEIRDYETGRLCQRIGNTLDPETGAWIPVDERFPEPTA